MSWFRPFRICGLPAAAALMFLALAVPVLQADEMSNPAKNLARMNCGATINLVGADGRVLAVTNKNSNPDKLLFEDNTLSYPLPKGETTFLLSLPRASTL